MEGAGLQRKQCEAGWVGAGSISKIPAGVGRV